MGNNPQKPQSSLNNDEDEVEVTSFEQSLSASQWYEKGCKHYLNAEFETAVHDLKRAVELDSNEARIALGKIFRDVLGGDSNVSEAIQLFNNACGKDGSGENQLGLTYYRGLGVEKDPVLAIRYFKEAMEKGFDEATSHLGFMYVDGKSLEKKVDEGLKMLQEVSARSGEANNYLGIIFTYGIGVTRNYVLALQHLNTAVEMGHLEAHVNLAQMHLNGWGTTRSAWESAKLLTRASEKGNRKAQCLIGIMYRDGVGVNKNEKLAKKWLQRSAEQGETLAMYCFGKYLLEKEEDTDWMTVMDWLSRASKQGNIDGELMENIYIDGLIKVFDGFTNNV
eukprot:TRINITY_DN10385_c0_g1_i1.p1 TRINITY_DN10385_c0_g1~~TRINITY_DN10385_c0_g1_i1.p1  ORF type:complete len:336 (+),score=66.77 TRINITY_DN10385_c0_g1_i1:33-1040(+)